MVPHFYSPEIICIYNWIIHFINQENIYLVCFFLGVSVYSRDDQTATSLNWGTASIQSYRWSCGHTQQGKQGRERENESDRFFVFAADICIEVSGDGETTLDQMHAKKKKWNGKWLNGLVCMSWCANALALYLSNRNPNLFYEVWPLSQINLGDQWIIEV